MSSDKEPAKSVAKFDIVEQRLSQDRCFDVDRV